MVHEITPQEVNIDELAMKVFLKALDIAGGPRKLIEHRNLTWVPSLIEASYAIVLHNEQKKTAAQIAQFLGITEQTARNILRADEEAVKKKIEEVGDDEEIRAHVAGGLAKLAYKEIKETLSEA